ncbi:hypothetical protein BO94DRAFT_10941 [Aspergillus sclerotioniger CBS 115572]|uniref:Uncharacterized protein n=1 Tax=Aspergillus sclerotioniger CBS 115572 TaxID=1450535 RepID=A0A317XD49_9EURO|nr:hypothetical protein BO94DRAFT_10941 [Aspergillus sclerotioniger CBS 115572]PWY96449.1 hypothetical protein BO94DRAFT_10941 [Aspergillus sclerotioniger CBS 115572]
MRPACEGEGWRAEQRERREESEERGKAQCALTAKARSSNPFRRPAVTHALILGPFPSFSLLLFLFSPPHQPFVQIHRLCSPRSSLKLAGAVLGCFPPFGLNCHLSVLDLSAFFPSLRLCHP